MFLYAVWKVLCQILRKIPRDTQTSIIISKQTVVIFTTFFISYYFIIGFIPNIIYFIYTV